MPRLFLGIDLPDAIDLDIQIMAGGIPGARWQTAEQLHLTVLFLGDVSGDDARRLGAALEQLEARAFTVQLRGVGVFPLRGEPRVLWFGLAEPAPMEELHDRCARIVDQLAIDRERRKYHPHATLARLAHADRRRLDEWITGHASYASPRFRVNELRLYSSVLTSAGPKYGVEAGFPLAPGNDDDDALE